MGREEGSGWGTRVYLWWIHFDIWQNQYNIVKFKNKIKLNALKKKKRLFSSSSLSAIRVVSSAYLGLLIFLTAILIPACASSSPGRLVGSNLEENESEVTQPCPTNSLPPMDCSPPVSSSHGILQARYWSELPFPSPGDLPDPGIKPRSPSLQADALTSEPPGNPAI